MKYLLRRSALAFLVAFLFTLTYSGILQNVQAQEIAIRRQPLNIAKDTIWTGPVPVCWETPNFQPDFDTEKGWVRNAIANTWERESLIRFVGWGRCKPFPLTASGIRIRIADTAKGPHVKGLGQTLSGVQSGMVLNFTFNNWSKENCSANSDRERCIRSIAVHEFGHAMGFAHEQNRPDTPSPCSERRQGTDGDTTVGVWDLDSVMNYCNPTWKNGGQLSATDIQGARVFYGNVWSDWGNLGGQLASAPAAVSWAPNRLDVFVQGKNNRLWHKVWDGTGWGEWTEDANGVMSAAPAVTSWGANRLDVFVRGADAQLWHKAWGGSKWSDWENLGGQLASAPAAVSWAPNRLDVFAQGKNNRLWHKVWDGTGWGEWTEDTNGVVSAAPAVTSWGANRLDVFVRGADAQLWHKAWGGSKWSDWQSLGGQLASAPAAVSWAPNRLDVFVQGKNNRLWHKVWSENQWSAWVEDPKGVMSSAPGVASWKANRLDVFVRGSGADLWHKAWDESQ